MLRVWEQAVTFNHSAHKRLWEWLGNNVDKTVMDWPEWKHNGGIFSAARHNFGCEYALRLSGQSHWEMRMCSDCPFAVSRAGAVPTCFDGHYWAWQYEQECGNDDAVANHAQAIRDFAIRHSVTCE